MKLHNEICHAHQTVKHHTDVVTMSDSMESLKDNKDANGYDLELSIVDAKLEFIRISNKLKTKADRVQTFIGGHDLYDLTKHTNKTHIEVLSDKEIAKTFADEIVIAVESVRDLEELSKILTKPSVVLQYAHPIELTQPYHYLIMLNDWLDASDYTLRDICFKTGQPILRTDKDKKELIRGMLNQFRNLTGISYPPILQIEVDALVEVKNKVLADLDTEPFLKLADYISVNTEKVPLMRRLWSL